jgi:hypothetical protein
MSTSTTYLHYRSTGRTSTSSRTLSEKTSDFSELTMSDKSIYKSTPSFIKVPEPLPRHSKAGPRLISYSNSFSDRSRPLKRHFSTSSVDRMQYFTNFPRKSR